MTIKQFIEKAIEGKFIINNEKHSSYDSEYDIYTEIPEAILLDPLAWQAVGRAEGQGKVRRTYRKGGKVVYIFSEPLNNKIALENMHNMIDALAEGKSLEEFIKTL